MQYALLGMPAPFEEHSFTEWLWKSPGLLIADPALWAQELSTNAGNSWQTRAAHGSCLRNAPLTLSETGTAKGSYEFDLELYCSTLSGTPQAPEH